MDEIPNPPDQADTDREVGSGEASVKRVLYPPAQLYRLRLFAAADVDAELGESAHEHFAHLYDVCRGHAGALSQGRAVIAGC